MIPGLMPIIPARGEAGNDAFTKVLLHMDGTNGSTTFTDSNLGGAAKTWTAGGSAQISTAASKFGGASGSFLVVGSGITTPDSVDFTLGTNDFTIDCWFNRQGGDGTVRFLCGQSNSAGNAGFSCWAYLDNVANKFNAVVSTTGTTVAASVVSTTSFTATGQHHVAIVRTGNTLKLFLDGIQEGGDVSFSGTINDSADSWGVGALGANTANTWNGYIDEFRFSNGIARWKNNFTPPAQAYAP